MTSGLAGVIQWYGDSFIWEKSVAEDKIAHHQARMSSFAQLYEAHLTYVFRYISFRVGNHAIAEELTSVVFEKALAAFHRYDKEKAEPQTWLIAIARNTIIDYFRKSSSRNTIPLENAIGVASGDPLPQEEVERKEEQQRLRFCVETLAEREQEIVSLKFGAELTNRRIASSLGLSENNVGIILYRAVCKLRTCVKDWLNGKR
jgi:RNA polymerase sigma factor (sigma-70 family)